MIVDKKVLLNYFKSSNSSTTELRCITNLYKSYVSIDKLIDGENEENKRKLSEYENKIYMVDGNKLTEIQKIQLEINRIDRVLSENKGSISRTGVERINEELDILRKLLVDYSKDSDNLTLDYIKKKISILQAILGIKNNFLLATYQAFIEKYMNICIEQNINVDKILEHKKRL